jgi:hypothetical protein
MGQEALPQGGNAGRRFRTIAFHQARQQQGRPLLETRRRQRLAGRSIVPDGFHQGEVGDVALGPHLFRRDLELFAEGARKGFMGAVAGLQRDGKNILRALRQRAPPR